MFKLTQKRVIVSVVLASFILVCAAIVPGLRSPFLSVIRLPLVVFSALGREINGIVFYHRNYVDASRLRGNNDFLRSELNRRQEERQELLRVKQLLEMKEQVGYKVIAARVIGRDPSNWASAVIIDKGTTHGIRKGYVIVTFLGLAGRVVDAGQATSVVMLINDPHVSVSSRIQRTRQEGMVSGSLGGTLIMKFLPKDSDIAVGDQVITSGLTPLYPKGLLIGSVTAIGADFSGASTYAIIRPAVDLSALEEVLVIMP
ncbi:MAG TPA: rod shape-determining protein MreC [Candidatus Omnitrophota bacterium]|nr:rod shape-determining protein MreC [Candidatus Omnitrophota bacterium]HRZ15268.1 rod shape-determining protein MreC [Candidatus Omnitrophota bacterium]